MTRTTIHQVIGIQDFTLLVFGTGNYCWQFRLVSADGKVFGEQKFYSAPEAAEKAGRSWIAEGR